MTKDVTDLLSRPIEGGALKPIIGLTQLVSGSIPLALTVDTITGSLIVEDDRTWAAIFDLGIYRWVNSKVAVNAAPTVLTDGPSGDQPGIYYNLATNEVLMLVQYSIDLETVSDWLDFEIGYTDAINGGGTFVPLTPKRRAFTAVAQGNWFCHTTPITPSIAVRYSDGARCVTMRVQTNDAAAAITVSWQGYVVHV